MGAELISGTRIAAEIRSELSARVAELRGKGGVVPGLAMIRVGEDPGSISYVSGKTKACQEIGLYSETVVYPEGAGEEQVLAKIAELNGQPRFHGILVQLPLPRHINPDRIVSAVSPLKDVDGIHPINVGKLLMGEPSFIPCTPLGIQEMLIRSGNSPEGKHVVICGRSNLVGKPMMAILVQKAKHANATVTIVHTGTKDMPSLVRQADIVIAAMGSPRAITANMVKDGAVVIDVGMNRVRDVTRKAGFRLVGDVDFDSVKEKVKAITPVPGGVGPMTVTMLMANTVKAAAMQLR
ncbi:MAG: bifunctional 5,10-methylene-tetrahydrofolate dehydrogenase/5,10-methylene-tetrahydrofolate cyclohydrolase [Chloroflexi bacterium]|nr:bifunctional 5,10-methylene-tetrahydrofolate dehydrogenase/5,10-methylene-tetrahydrofolate cyclohydrolase [Chloroflexota bacterium]